MDPPAAWLSELGNDPLRLGQMLQRQGSGATALGPRIYGCEPASVLRAYQPTGCNSMAPMPPAMSRPAWPCNDGYGCSDTVRFDPATRTLAPRPAATETSAVAPQYLPVSIPA